MSSSKKTHVLFAIATGVVASLIVACPHGDGPGPRTADTIDLVSYRRIVEALADDSMEGRGVLTHGNRLAAELLEREFRAAGLKPGGTDGGYLQCFEHPVTVSAKEVSLEIGGHAVAAGFVAPTAFSGSAPFAGELVFGGYGIHAPDEGYDDYAELDADGKVLLLLRFEPREKDPASPLNGERPSRHSGLRRKVFEAKSRGALAVLFVAAPRPEEKPDTRVPSLVGVEAESSAGIPVLHVLPAEAESWLEAAGTSLSEQVAAIERDFVSRPIRLGLSRGNVLVEREKKRLCNVVGLLPGTGALADEAVVIGAHFDHLGYGQAGTMEPGERVIHSGADDNASGAAGLVSLAHALARSSDHAARRTIVFVAFNGEEIGLAGSSAYVERPAVPLEKTDAMLNMDMIGRLRDRKLVVLGSESGDRWSEWLHEEAEGRGLELTLHGDGYGPSDQTAFYSRGVPVLHFFTGAHGDYHKSTDDAALINYEGAAAVLGLVAAVTRRAAGEPARVAYRESTTGPAMAGDSRGYGAWLGTVPDYTAMSPGAAGGVLLSGVRKGGPAGGTGIRGGDRIVAMAGRTIDNLYDMTFVLRDNRPGEVIEVVVNRDGERLTFAVTLGSRSAMKKAPGPGASPHGGGPEDDPSGLGPLVVMDPSTLLYTGEERHLRNVRQLTFEGENAEAYWSPDGERLVFQARGEGVPCDRIYTFELASGKIEPVSSGRGRTTCAYFTWPKGGAILYASTHLAGAACPPEADHGLGYVWPLYGSYDIFLKRPGRKLARLTKTPGYDAEATACFVDGRVVFTSVRDGDLDLYVMNGAKSGAKVTRLTEEPGYDGGAFFSPDCSRIVWRASRPKGKDLEDYRSLLAKGLVRPTDMEIFVADADGTGVVQVTANGAANFAPYFLPDNRRVVFASNVGDPGGRNFDLYVIDPYAEDPAATLERITMSPVFEAFPMFSPDGRRLVFASNRNAKTKGDTNLFLADWVD